MWRKEKKLSTEPADIEMTNKIHKSKCYAINIPTPKTVFWSLMQGGGPTRNYHHNHFSWSHNPKVFQPDVRSDRMSLEMLSFPFLSIDLNGGTSNRCKSPPSWKKHGRGFLNNPGQMNNFLWITVTLTMYDTCRMEKKSYDQGALFSKELIIPKLSAEETALHWEWTWRHAELTDLTKVMRRASDKTEQDPTPSDS